MMSESVTQMAWRRFSRGLPCEVDSVERALELRLRSLAQWQTCLESAKHHASRIEFGGLHDQTRMHQIRT